MRFLMYAKTNGVEQLFYDSESGNARMAVAQPSLKLELSKAGSLDFTILPTHPMYDSFMKMKTYVRVMQDDKEIFRGRVLQIEDTTYMERQIQCEGDLAYLIDSLQPPQQTVAANTTSTITKSNASYRAQYGNHVPAKSSTTQKVTLGSETNTTGQLATQFARYISHHNSQMETEKQFTVGNVTVDDVGTVSFKSTSYRDTKESIDSDLVKQYGGYLQTRKNPNGPTYIDWLKQPTETSSQRIVLGMNMIDLQQQFEGDELFTIFVPTGDSDLTIASVNNGNIGLEDAAGIAKYGRIYKTQSYSGVKDAAELKKLGQDYMTANYKPEKMSLNVKAIDMNLLDGEIDAIHVGSIVTVISDPHDIDVSLTCISIEYDIQNPENNSYEIGDPSETLSQKNATSAAATAAATASAKRSGSYAGAAAVTMKDVINRHAENISDHADALYKLEADLVQIHAKCIEITATEKVTITADTIDMNASGEINLTSRGKMTMASNAQINFNDNLYIGDVMAGYDFYNIGNAWMQSLTIGGHLYVADIQDEDNGKWDTGVLSGFTSVRSMSYALYKSGNLGTISGYLEDAVTSFGTATATGGEVNIPYYTFSGGTTKAGDITFNIADMEYYQDHVGIRSIGNWYWGGDDDRNYYALVTANDGTQQAVTQPAITMDTILGTNWYTNVLAKGPADSGTQYTVGSQLVYLQADNNNCYITNTSGAPTSGSSGNIIAQIVNPKPSSSITSITNGSLSHDEDDHELYVPVTASGTNVSPYTKTLSFSTSTTVGGWTNNASKNTVAVKVEGVTVGSATVSAPSVSYSLSSYSGSASISHYIEAGSTYRLQLKRGGIVIQTVYLRGT